MSQLTSNARALGLAAVIMLALGFVPGFPTIIFAGLALSCAAAAYLARGRSSLFEASPEQRIGETGSKPVTLQRAEAQEAAIALLSSSPLAIRLGPSLASDALDTELEPPRQQCQTRDIHRSGHRDSRSRTNRGRCHACAPPSHRP
ncbi:FHIPEP family type III secretion protein [Mesorhizobium sp. AaZ16]|uniref:FHIPEP family type III secretion protein n=1 Tax=Mesorhizobium sp. AaZ16 TaxID=3402289 RepID=UPI00374EF27E